MSKLLIFDGSNVFMRGFFAVPEMTTSKGFHTNAIKGTINIVTSVIKARKPTHVAFVFDRPHPTHRHKIYPEYKGTREKDPEQQARLRPQRKPVYDLLRAMGIKVVHKKGTEADDIIGTLARLAHDYDEDMEVEVVSNDKDFAQLLRKRLRILKYDYQVKDYHEITHRNCAKHYLVEPSRVPCMLMMQGDKVDNIPGVDGIGPVALAKLVASADRIEDADIRVLNKTQAANFEAARKQFRLTRRLVTIHQKIIDYDIAKLAIGEPDLNAVHIICKALEARQIENTIGQYARFLN